MENTRGRGRPFSGSEKRVQFNIRIDKSIYDWLSSESENTGMTKTQIVEYAIFYYQSQEKHMSKVMYDIVNNVDGNRKQILKATDGVADRYRGAFVKIICDEFNLDYYIKTGNTHKGFADRQSLTLRDVIGGNYADNLSEFVSGDNEGTPIYDVIKEKIRNYLLEKIREEVSVYLADKEDVNKSHIRSLINAGKLGGICEMICDSECDRLKLDNMDKFCKNIGIGSPDITLDDLHRKFPAI